MFSIQLYYIPILGNGHFFIHLQRRLLKYSIHIDNQFQHHTRVVIPLATFGIEFPEKPLFQLIAIYCWDLEVTKKMKKCNRLVILDTNYLKSLLKEKEVV